MGLQTTVAHQHHVVAGDVLERPRWVIREDATDKGIDDIVRDCHLVGWHMAKTEQVEDLMRAVWLGGY